MDHFTFDPRLDGIGGRGAPTHFSEQGPTFVNPALRSVKYICEVTDCDKDCRE